MSTYERCKIGILLHDVGRVIPAEFVFNIEDEALYIYQKHMYDQRQDMICYHPWSYAAYLVLKEKVEVTI